MSPELDLDVLPGDYAVARLDPSEPVPPWARDGTLSATVVTADELTIVCAAGSVPSDARSEGPFSALAVRGPLDFALTGILASLAAPLAAAGISIFALSTFDTDVLLIRSGDLPAASAALRAAGHRIDV
jgi:uncharacterized protein